MKTKLFLCFALAALSICWVTPGRAENSADREAFGMKVSVLGAVNKQGVVRVADGRLITAIAEGGGWTRSADLKRITLLKRTTDGGTEAVVIDVAAMLSGDGSDPKVERGDVVYIPEKAF